MPGRDRVLPGKPSLRYLKLEAKRRLALGEFETLSDAQLAVAREHGQPSWAALKQFVSDPSATEDPALTQLRWVIARFRDAGEPGWATPDEDELRQHFEDGFLAEISADALARTIASVAADLREELIISKRSGQAIRARIGGLDVTAVVGDATHKLTGLRGLPLGSWINDPRTTAPLTRASGEVPGWAAEISRSTFGELGLPGLVLAGGEPGGPVWVTATGWKDLDRGEILQPDDCFIAPGIAAVVTITAVLRLVAAGRVGLDAPANRYLCAVRLADDTITVRELLAHTGGVDSPSGRSLLSDRVPELAAVTGRVIGCGGPRGIPRSSNGGIAALGELVAEVTGAPFREAAAQLVLGPLGMRDSSFPVSVSEISPRAVSGYGVTAQGGFRPVPVRVCTLEAAGGLWASPADIVRLAAGWASLLPDALVHEVLSPACAGNEGEPTTGLGWLLSSRRDIAMAGGALPGSVAWLLVRIRDRQVQLTLTSRLVAVDRVNEHVLRAWASHAR
jgi:CubicO group peptidase (beta-lactamase class C family)